MIWNHGATPGITSQACHWVLDQSGLFKILPMLIPQPPLEVVVVMGCVGVPGLSVKLYACPTVMAIASSLVSSSLAIIARNASEMGTMAGTRVGAGV